MDEDLAISFREGYISFSHGDELNIVIWPPWKERLYLARRSVGANFCVILCSPMSLFLQESATDSETTPQGFPSAGDL